jgi:hypothetical protein
MRNTQLATQIKRVNAIVPSAGAVSTLTAIVVDGTGYGRVAWGLSTGAAAGGATLSFKIQSSATSGGSYADVTSATLTGLVAASDGSKQYILDMAIDPLKPFMKVVAVVGAATFACSVIADLYRGLSYPVDTAYATQYVVI